LNVFRVQFLLGLTFQSNLFLIHYIILCSVLFPFSSFFSFSKIFSSVYFWDENFPDSKAEGLTYTKRMHAYIYMAFSQYLCCGNVCKRFSVKDYLYH